jgi:hypothetical protein
VLRSGGAGVAAVAAPKHGWSCNVFPSLFFKRGQPWTMAELWTCVPRVQAWGPDIALLAKVPGSKHFLTLRNSLLSLSGGIRGYQPQPAALAQQQQQQHLDSRYFASHAFQESLQIQLSIQARKRLWSRTCHPKQQLSYAESLLLTDVQQSLLLMIADSIPAFASLLPQLPSAQNGHVRQPQGIRIDQGCVRQPETCSPFKQPDCKIKHLVAAALLITRQILGLVMNQQRSLRGVHSADSCCYVCDAVQHHTIHCVHLQHPLVSRVRRMLAELRACLVARMLDCMQALLSAWFTGLATCVTTEVVQLTVYLLV